MVDNRELTLLFSNPAVALIRNNTIALSISTDQRLNMWSLEMKDDMQVKMIDAAFVDVPDPSSMNVTEYQ